MLLGLCRRVCGAERLRGGDLQAGQGNVVGAEEGGGGEGWELSDGGGGRRDGAAAAAAPDLVQRFWERREENGTQGMP